MDAASQIENAPLSAEPSIRPNNVEDDFATTFGRPEKTDHAVKDD